MNNMFIFAIGGTGARVVKSLTHLLASGMKINNVEAVIPIIIDPDIANGDLTRTVEILNLYREIRRKGLNEKNSFFKTKISSLYDLDGGG